MALKEGTRVRIKSAEEIDKIVETVPQSGAALFWKYYREDMSCYCGQETSVIVDYHDGTVDLEIDGGENVWNESWLIIL